MSTVISMKALLESGVHFGHRTNKWDPHMRPYIFTERNGIHIIDLQQTVKALNTAYNLVRDTVSNGGFILFVGTKRQAQETVKEEAERCGMPYVTERWLGGMLTNWSTMAARIGELDRIEKMHETGEINRLTKKEILLIDREVKRLLIRLSGVRKMKRVPDLLFVIDISREETAIHEANLTGVPVIAMVDTNCDPKGVDYVIPSNDDAIRAIKLMVAKIADAVIEGKATRKEDADMDDGRDVRETASMSAPKPNVDLAPDLEDIDLFGEATLAKLSQAKVEEVVVERVDAVADSIEEAKSEAVVEKVEAAEAVVEEVKAEVVVEKVKKARTAKAEKAEKASEDKEAVESDSKE
jgi:small subunit ribosomal protein S2